MTVEAETDDQREGNQYDVQPRYFVFGGLVFTSLSRDYMRDSGREGAETAAGEFNYELFFRSREEPEMTREEPVVLSSVLSDPVNANFSTRGRVLVDRINGIRIEKIADVIRAFATSTNTHDMIEFGKRGTFECLDHAEAVRANDKILKTYGISQDRHL